MQSAWVGEKVRLRAVEPEDWELGYAKVNVGVYDFNEHSHAMHERLGFVQEGNLRSVVFTGGRRWDEVLYGMTADEFADRWPGAGEVRRGDGCLSG